MKENYNIYQSNKQENNNIIPIRKSLTRFNVIPVEWRALQNEEGKRLSDRELQTLWTINRLAEYKDSKTISISYATLTYQCGFSCSQKTMSRYLKSMSKAKIINYVTKKAHFGYQKDLIIEVNSDALSSPLNCKFTSIKNPIPNLSNGQICQTNLSEYIVKNTKKIKKEKINKKEKAPENTTTNPLSFANGSLNEPAKESSLSHKTTAQIIPIHKERLLTATKEKEIYLQHLNRKHDPDQISGFAAIFDKLEIIKTPKAKHMQKTILKPPSNPIEPVMFPTKEKMLQKKIITAFNIDIADKIITNYQFIKQDDDCIKVSGNAGISDYVKQQLRDCIKSVYGQEIKIIADTDQSQIESKIQDEKQQPQLWKDIKKELVNFISHSDPENVIKAWFDTKLVIEEYEEDKKIIFIGTSFFIRYIQQNYLIALDNCFKEMGYTYELKESI